MDSMEGEWGRGMPHVENVCHGSQEVGLPRLHAQGGPWAPGQAVYTSSGTLAPGRGTNPTTRSHLPIVVTSPNPALASESQHPLQALHFFKAYVSIFIFNF